MAEGRPVHVLTKKTIQTYKPTSRLRVQYPHTWFIENKKSKPSVVIRRSDMPLLEMKRSIIRSVDRGVLNKELVKTYLVKYGLTIESELPIDWESYGVKIGSSGDKVSPISLIMVQNSTEPMGDLEIGGMDDLDTDKNVLMALLYIYRVTRLQGTNIPENLGTNMKRQLDSSDTSIIGRNIHKLNQYTSWQNDSDYRTLIAAYDMFFFRFQKHPLASVRFGTISSRFRDCEALLSIGHICETLNISANNFTFWLFTDQARYDMLRLTDDHNLHESQNEFSYFPYQTDFGLIQKSAYSAVANPTIFSLIHITCTLLGSTRSLNARYISDIAMEANTKNAIVMAYAFKSTVNFTEDGRAGSEGVARIAGDQDDINSIHGPEWYDFLAKRNFKMPDAVKIFFNTVKNSLPEPREGSIGDFVKRYIMF